MTRLAPVAAPPARDPWPRRIFAGFCVAAVIIVIGIFAWRGTGSPAPAPAPAAPPLPAAELAAVNGMTRYCTQDPVQLAAMVDATRQIEVKDGITDEDDTQLARHLLTAVEGNGTHRMSCVEEFAAYVTLREG